MEVEKAHSIISEIGDRVKKDFFKYKKRYPSHGAHLNLKNITGGKMSSIQGDSFNDNVYNRVWKRKMPDCGKRFSRQPG